MIKNQPIQQFLDALASKASTPGGGSAAAISGAMGAALVSMVCNLTIGKKNYEDVSADLTTVLAKAEGLRQRLTESVNDDIRVFNRVMAAYGLPKETDEQKAARSTELQAALQEATDVPLSCARLCYEVIELSQVAAEKGNKNVISDAGVAVLAAQAGLRSAALNVYINAGSIKDRAFVSSRIAELEILLDTAGEKTEICYALVKSKL
jgi:formiminotetrahydrofolate cyclodeaminase